MKKALTILSFVLICLLVFSIVPVTAFADSEKPSIGEIWDLMEGKSYINKDIEPNSSLSAVSENGNKLFRFSCEDSVVDFQIDKINVTHDFDDCGYDDTYSFFSYNGKEETDIEIKIVDEVVQHVYVYGSLFGYDFMTYDMSGNYTDTSIEPNGSNDYPWMLGDVEVIMENDMLEMWGEGEIPDYDDLTARIWNDGAGNVRSFFIGGNITRLGKNACKNIGADVDFEDYEYVDIGFYGEDFKEIGASAFEGVNTNYVNIPESVELIESRAFADTGIKEITFEGLPETIADDAFAGVTANVKVRKTMWPESARKQFGGDLTYSDQYMFTVNMIIDGEDMGYMTNTIDEGETFTFDFIKNFDWLVFDRWEQAEGQDLSGQPADNLSFEINSDIVITAYYHYNEDYETEDGSVIFGDDNISGEEILAEIIGKDTVDRIANTVKTVFIVVGAVIGCGIAVGVFFIVRAIVKKNKKAQAAPDAETDPESKKDK